MMLRVVFSAPLAVTVLQLCIHSSLVIGATLILECMTMTPADMEEGSPGHSALSTLVLPGAMGFPEFGREHSQGMERGSLPSPFGMRRLEAIYVV